MKYLLQIYLYKISKYVFYLVLILFVFTSNVFSQECTETTRARMIKSGLSDKTIEEQCGKIGETEKVSENVATEDIVEKKEDSEENSEENSNKNGRWRIGGGTGSGSFMYTNSSYPSLDGKFDHDLSGSTFTLSYFALNNENNFFHGGGWRYIDVSGSETFSSDATPGYYTYYSSSYGYYDLSVTVTSFRSNLIYAMSGYNYEINDTISFQPNLRYGINFVVAQWKEKTEWASYTDQEWELVDNTASIGLDIVLPFVYEINNKFSVGADICICGSILESTTDTEKYNFSNFNVFNVFFDYHL